MSYIRRYLNLIPLKPGEKVPLLSSWKAFQTQRASTEQIAIWARQTLNFGIVTGNISKVVCVDADTKAAVQWVESHLPKTPMTTITVRGRHFFYRHPGGLVGNGARIKCAEDVHIDVRGDGGYVVAPGSRHPSGHLYLEGDPGWNNIKFLDLPQFSPAWFPDTARREACNVPMPGRIIGPERLYQAQRYVLACSPAIEGQGGDNLTYRLCCDLVRVFGLGFFDALFLLETHWNPYCRPPWSRRDLVSKLRNAAKYGEGQEGYLLERGT